jgi:hypothetical protein
MKIKKPKKKVAIKEDHISGINYPIFCFKYLQTCSIKDCRDYDFFFKFLERLQKLAELGWNEIIHSHRHGFGTEKILLDKIKPALPLFITPDVGHFTVFRAGGNNKSFLGIRNGTIFHIVFIEANFGDVYDH